MVLFSQRQCLHRAALIASVATALRIDDEQPTRGQLLSMDDDPADPVMASVDAIFPNGKGEEDEILRLDSDSMHPDFPTGIVPPWDMNPPEPPKFDKFGPSNFGHESWQEHCRKTHNALAAKVAEADSKSAQDATDAEEKVVVQTEAARVDASENMAAALDAATKANRLDRKIKHAHDMQARSKEALDKAVEEDNLEIHKNELACARVEKMKNDQKEVQDAGLPALQESTKDAAAAKKRAEVAAAAHRKALEGLKKAAALDHQAQAVARSADATAQVKKSEKDAVLHKKENLEQEIIDDEIAERDSVHTRKVNEALAVEGILRKNLALKDAAAAEAEHRAAAAAISIAAYPRPADKMKQAARAQAHVIRMREQVDDAIRLAVTAKAKANTAIESKAEWKHERAIESRTKAAVEVNVAKEMAMLARAKAAVIPLNDEHRAESAEIEAAAKEKVVERKQGTLQARLTIENLAKHKEEHAKINTKKAEEVLKSIQGETEAEGLATSLTTCDEDLVDESGHGYRGCQTRTVNGHVCQDWNGQAPHRHEETALAFPAAGLTGNYCRNPGKNQRGIWCYTTDPLTPFEFCHPIGETHAPTPPPTPTVAPTPPAPLVYVFIDKPFPQDIYVGDSCPANTVYKRHVCGAWASNWTGSERVGSGPFSQNHYLGLSAHCNTECDCTIVKVECEVGKGSPGDYSPKVPFGFKQQQQNQTQQNETEQNETQQEQEEEQEQEEQLQQQQQEQQPPQQA